MVHTRERGRLTCGFTGAGAATASGLFFNTSPTTPHANTFGIDTVVGSVGADEGILVTAVSITHTAGGSCAVSLLDGSANVKLSVGGSGGAPGEWHGKVFLEGIAQLNILGPIVGTICYDIVVP